MAKSDSFSFRFAGQYRPMGAGFEVSALIDLGLLIPLFLFVSQTVMVQPAVTLELPRAEFNEGVSAGAAVVTLTREKMVFFNDERTTLQGLPSAFRRRAFEEPDTVLIIEADRQVPYEDLLRIYSMAQEAGISTVALAAGILEAAEEVPTP